MGFMAIYSLSHSLRIRGVIPPAPRIHILGVLFLVLLLLLASCATTVQLDRLEAKVDRQCEYLNHRIDTWRDFTTDFTDEFNEFREDRQNLKDNRADYNTDITTTLGVYKLELYLRPADEGLND